MIFATLKDELVWKVRARFMCKKKWEDLKSEYLKLKREYITKYGESERKFEKFDSLYTKGDAGIEE